MRYRGVPVTSDLGKYLGVRIFHRKTTATNFSELLDKVHYRLAGWKRKLLSFAARLTLVKSVLTTIPTYLMQIVALPNSVMEEIEKCIRSFYRVIRKGKKEYTRLTGQQPRSQSSMVVWVSKK